MERRLVYAKSVHSQLQNVNEDMVCKVRQELIKAGKYQGLSSALITSSENPIARRSPRRLTSVWDTRIKPFTDTYKTYCLEEDGAFLALSNVRNHVMIERKKSGAQPESTDVTQMFTLKTIDVLVPGEWTNTTKYYLVILKLN